MLGGGMCDVLNVLFKCLVFFFVSFYLFELFFLFVFIVLFFLLFDYWKISDFVYFIFVRRFVLVL